MQLKELILTDFKGVRSAKYNFSSITKIEGQNGSGKSTIADAWYWMWTDKNYELKSNPNIRPLGIEECLPRVEAVVDIDGIDVTLAKQQKRVVSKPNDKGISKITLTNTYEINGVPKTERDFKADLVDRGIDIDKFLALSHPEVFICQKAADMRKILFEMTSEKSDLDIALMGKDTSAVAELLESYKFEEIEAMHKASKKKAEAQLKSIPDQIVGMEKAKADIDVAELELNKSAILDQINEKEAQYEDGERAAETIQKQYDHVMELKMELNSIQASANDELLKDRRKLQNEAGKASQKFHDAELQHKQAEQRIERLKESMAFHESERKKYGTHYEEVFKESFDDSKWQLDTDSVICPNCGQEYPTDKIQQIRNDFDAKKDAAKRKFEEDKKARLANIISFGNSAKKAVEDAKEEIEVLQAQIDGHKKEKIAANREYTDVMKKIKELPDEPDLSENQEYERLCLELQACESVLHNASASTGYRNSLKNEIEVLRQELAETEKDIGKASNNVRIDEQISELQQKQQEYEQAKADSEKILYQLSLVSKKKNEILVKEINANFEVIKWKLFEYQKNGEYKECCIPMVDGRKFGESTNTGREIIAKLDICNSLQKFFKCELPVFLDNAESINDFNLPKLDCQLITLNVTEDKELVIDNE